MSKILLTGASGTLGRNFLELAGNAADLEILALLRDESRPIKRYKSVKECRADLNNSRHVSQIVRDFSPQTIIHCAATGMEFARTEWFELLRFNVDFSVALCEAAARSRAGHFIFIGTGMAYRSLPRPLKEEDALDTLHPYGASKAAADMLVRAAAAEFDVPLTVLRPFSFSGLGDDRSRLFPSLLRAAATGKTLELTSGLQVRDHISARDVASAILAATRTVPRSEGPQIYNIGSGSSATVRELVEGIVAELELQVDLKFGARNPGRFEPQHLVADAAKAKADLGWMPTHRFSHAVWELAAESFPELRLRQPAHG